MTHIQENSCNCSQWALGYDVIGALLNIDKCVRKEWLEKYLSYLANLLFNLVF